MVGFGTTFFLLTKVALGVTDEDIKNSSEAFALLWMLVGGRVCSLCCSRDCEFSWHRIPACLCAKLNVSEVAPDGACATVRVVHLPHLHVMLLARRDDEPQGHPQLRSQHGASAMSGRQEAHDSSNIVAHAWRMRVAVHHCCRNRMSLGIIGSS